MGIYKNKKELLKNAIKYEKENSFLRAKLLKISDITKAYEEGGNAFTCLRKIANVIRYDD